MGVSPEVIAVVGRSGSGKTYIIEQLIPRLCARGVRVATLKHTHHRVFEDTPGSDTHQHAEAGAKLSALCGPGFFTLFHGTEPDLRRMVDFIGAGVDLVILEGYKACTYRKVEIVRNSEPLLNSQEAWLTLSSDEVACLEGAVLKILL